jgi:FixJ family two-component response regulator
MRDENPIVLIIDDDPEFRDSVARLLRTVDLQTREFSSASDFLKVDPLDGPTCLESLTARNMVRMSQVL